jgi:Ca2+-binding EF-hand superfamily protein
MLFENEWKSFNSGNFTARALRSVTSMRKHFEQMDSDHDGRINRDELSASLVHNGLPYVTISHDLHLPYQDTIIASVMVYVVM